MIKLEYLLPHSKKENLFRSKESYLFISLFVTHFLC